MIVILTIFSLIAGLVCGFFGLGDTVFSVVREHTDLILYVLMFCVGIMIGMREGILAKIKEYHLRIFIIPAGIMAGSLLGGALCAMLLKLPLDQVTYGSARQTVPAHSAGNRRPLIKRQF